MNVRVAGKWVVLTMSLLSVWSAALSEERVIVAGTYSSFEFNEEGGDLLGYEIRLIPTRFGYRGIIQIAEGEAGDLSVVPVQVQGTFVSFRVPLDDSAYACFKGHVSSYALSGDVVYPSGNSETLHLKRSISYWERN